MPKSVNPKGQRPEGGKPLGGLVLPITIVTTVTLLGCILRLVGASTKQFWSDEAVTYMVANEHASFFEMLKFWWGSTRVGDPPLFYILSYLNVHGSSSSSELRLRVVPLAFGVACIPMMYFLVREFASEAHACLACALVAVNSYAIQYSQEYRLYSLLHFASIMNLHSLCALIRRPSNRTIFYYLGSCGLLFYSHYFGGIAMSAGYLLLLGIWAGKKFGRQPTVPGWQILLVPVALFVLGFPVLAHAYNIIMKVAPGTEAQGEMKKYFLLNREAGYSWKLLKTFASYYESRDLRWQPSVVIGFTALGALGTLVRQPRFMGLLALWTVLAALPTFIVYEKLQYPFEERRNIYLLAPFLYLLAAGILLPGKVLRFWGSNWRLASAAPLTTGIFTSVVLLASASTYKQYYAGGYRNDSNQADWKGMAEYVAEVGGADSIVNLQRGSQGWIRPTYYFYHRQFLKPDNLWLMNSIAEVRQRPGGGGNIWFLVVDPWNRDKQLLESLLKIGRWKAFYGGFMVLLPPEAPGTTVFPVQTPAKYAVAISGLPPDAIGEIEMAGPTSQMFRVTGKRPYGTGLLDRGIYEAKALINGVQKPETTVTVHRYVEPGEWQSALDFTEIQPSSSLFDVYLHDGDPYLNLMHNGTVVYRTAIDQAGTYRVELEAKHDVPGPVVPRVIIGETRRVQDLTFGKKDNHFAPKSTTFSLPTGPITIGISHRSFTRVGHRKPEHPDDLNEFSFKRWRLVPEK